MSTILPQERNEAFPMSQTSDKSIVTLINTFTVDPGNQQRLVDLLIRATDGFVSRASGFISSTLHRSVDGTKVAMYAQWAQRRGLSGHAPGPRPSAIPRRGAHHRKV
jgi:quinol monooxygenase YgiN